MPDYAYKAVDERGQIVKGIRFANNDRELAARIADLGFRILDYRTTRVRQFANFFQSFQLGKVNRSELIEFSNNMGVMSKAGIPLTKGLGELQQDLENKYFKNAIGGIIEDIQAGSSFHEAISKKPRVFAKLYVDVIKIGEHTGRLDKVFFDLAHHYKQIDELVKNVRKAVIYPSFVLVALVIAAFVFLTMVFPAIFTMLEEFDVPLPTITKIVMAVSTAMQMRWDVGLMCIACFIVAIILLRKNKTTRYYFDWFELRIPFIKSFFIQLHMAFFTRYLAMLIGAGVDILTSLQLSIQSINNLALQKTLKRSRERVLEGSLLSETLRNIRIIPNMVTRMIAIGEESGNLPEQMDYTADYYNKELSQQVAMAMALLEPIIIFLLAGLAVGLVMGVMLPIYDMVNQLSFEAGGDM